ncbi:TIGR03089 family protein [Nesterenkonia jeotgali]|uniref:AMP-dependent synthetase/ligase domain-containing protein n=1 Tax=Nesterenkonia jeotgali TaxID=317018 RepID=A0A0W8IJU8_9MICC|nr:TIGR03089 family protein [Nesterenkonia jeotgali]KUG60327.1 hypothetical protein AVL63_07930 [Nesterenkonia jeotgali]
MTPLTLSGSTAGPPQTFPALLDLLEARPQPALIWYGAGQGEERVELSGRVLQNWTVKLIGLFDQESEMEADDAVLIHAAAHWKAAAVLLAAGALGWKISVIDPGAPQSDQEGLAAAVTAQQPGLVVTERPGDWTGSGTWGQLLGDAELAALSPGLLDASFEEATGQRLPAWALDISAEVRQHPDQLPAPLPPRELSEVPVPEGARSELGTAAGRGGGLVVVGASPQAPLQDWGLTHWGAPDLLPQMLETWAQSRPVVLFPGDPTAQPQAWEQMLRNEAVR